MKSLTPRLASEFAEIVYQVIDAGPSQFFRLEASPRLGQSFELGLNKGPVVGESGGVFGLFQKTTGFAVVSRGKAHYDGHHVLAFRGTKSGHDWLTNGNIGYSTSSGGSQVHSGFNKTFESMQPALDELLAPHIRNKAPAGIHCVGHSLGGALASLAAEWIKQKYRRNVRLYTFGAPRVGLNSFALNSSHGADALFRCTHGADPVPNVPLWPFVHAPVNGIEYRLDKSRGIDPEAHKMGRKANPGYRNTADTDDWDALHQNSMNYLTQSVRLDYERRHEATFSGYWAEKISAALITLLKDAGYYSAVLAQAAISSTLTFYDLLARTLEQIADASKQFADQTRGLLGHMLAFARAAVTTVVDLSFRFIRWVFDRTAGALYDAVRQSIDRT